MNRPFRTDPEASAELEEAAIWYENQRPGLGVEASMFLTAVVEAQPRPRPIRVGLDLT